MLEKISVIIPCYNVECFVEKAVRSIMQQTYSNLEIICIDDASIDRTLIILETLKKEDCRIIVVQNEQNLGLIRTLNKGIAISSGTFIARMDSDDYSLSDRLEKEMLFMLTNKLDICGCWMQLMNEKGKLLAKKKMEAQTDKGIMLFSFFDSPLYHPTVLAKASVFRHNMYRDDKEVEIIEDYELWCRLIQMQYKIGVLPQFLFYYRINPNGESCSKRQLQNSNFINCASKHISNFYPYSISENSVGIISGKITSYDLLELKKSIVDIKHISRFFLEQADFMESKDIKGWTNWKISYVLLRSLFCCSTTKISLIPFIMSNFSFFCHYEIIFLFMRKLKSLLANLGFANKICRSFFGY